MKGLFKHLRGDIFGGVTAGIVALPLALAFGVQSGMGAAAGLYGAFILGILAAIFGGTPTQISGPTAPMTVISASLIGMVVAANQGDLEKSLPIILVIFFLGGVIQIAFGVLKIGAYVKYIPYPAVSGFMSGIGVIILITQIFPLLGYNPAKDKYLIEKFSVKAHEMFLEREIHNHLNEGSIDQGELREIVTQSENMTEGQVAEEVASLVTRQSQGVMGTLRYLNRALSNVNWIELCLAVATIVIIYGSKRITTLIPGALIALVAITLTIQIFDIDALTIGDESPIPEGFPSLNLAIFSEFRLIDVLPYLGTAAILACLGTIDSLLTSVVADRITKTHHNSSKELIGQGIGNSISAFFGGLPGAGATIRTVVNINAGGKTNLSGVIHGILLLVILLALGPVASTIPLSVLAGILVTVGIGVMDHRGLRTLRKMPLTDSITLISVLSLTVFLDLITAVAIGLIISCVRFVKKMSDVTSEGSSLKLLSEMKEGLWEDEKEFPKELTDKVFIKHIDGPLFFGFTSSFSQLTHKISKGASYAVIRMERVPYMDQSGVFTLEESIRQLQEKNVIVLLVGIQKQPLQLMKSMKIIPNMIAEKLAMDTLSEAVQYLKRKTSS